MQQRQVRKWRQDFGAWFTEERAVGGDLDMDSRKVTKDVEGSDSAWNTPRHIIKTVVIFKNVKCIIRWGLFTAGSLTYHSRKNAGLTNDINCYYLHLCFCYCDTPKCLRCKTTLRDKWAINVLSRSSISVCLLPQWRIKLEVKVCSFWISSSTAMQCSLPAPIKRSETYDFCGSRWFHLRRKDEKAL